MARRHGRAPLASLRARIGAGRDANPAGTNAAGAPLSSVTVRADPYLLPGPRSRSLDRLLREARHGGNRSHRDPRRGDQRLRGPSGRRPRLELTSNLVSHRALRDRYRLLGTSRSPWPTWTPRSSVSRKNRVNGALDPAGDIEVQAMALAGRVRAGTRELLPRQPAVGTGAGRTRTRLPPAGHAHRAPPRPPRPGTRWCKAACPSIAPRTRRRPSDVTPGPRP